MAILSSFEKDVMAESKRVPFPEAYNARIQELAWACAMRASGCRTFASVSPRGIALEIKAIGFEREIGECSFLELRRSGA